MIIIILEKSKKKKVGGLWEAREDPPESIHRKSENTDKKFLGGSLP